MAGAAELGGVESGDHQLNRGVRSRPIQGLAKWLIALAGALSALSILLSLPFFFPSERDPHGGAFSMLGALVLLAAAALCAAIGGLLHWWRGRP